jgi:hypothetical protein
VKQFFANLRKRLRGPDLEDMHEVTFDEHSFSVLTKYRDGVTEDTMRWADVVKVEAYKIDLFVIDSIALRLTDANAEDLEIDEECRGHNAFFSEAARRFEFPEDWLLKVFPVAFATNYRVLYACEP